MRPTERASYTVTEDVYAGYGQYPFGFDKLGIFTGLRVESTREKFNAFAVTDQNVIQQVSSAHNYTDFLPSLQARDEFTPSIVGYLPNSGDFGAASERRPIGRV